MINEWNKPEKPDEETLDNNIKALREQLILKHVAMKEKKLPVIVILEGFGAAGKGSAISRIIKYIDPRFFNVCTMDKITEEEARRPFLYRHFIRIPEAGKYTFYDGGTLEELAGSYLRKELSKKEYKTRLTSVINCERQLADNGYLVLKFFLHIDQELQEKRLHKLLENDDTKWRVNSYDLWQNKHYDKALQVYDEYLDKTNKSHAPWHLIDASSKKWSEFQILSVMISEIDKALSSCRDAKPISDPDVPLRKTPLLSDISLDKFLTDEEYDKELDKCQKKLAKLHNRLYREKVPVILAYEGWDAAGKGGNIRRITGALDPRGFEVHPIASPEPHEKARHYLWRFFNRLPKTGHIAIFDRTWYGRVMVERLEGFCSENDWKRAYREINEFEKELYDWGAIIIKFWVQIDKDVQLERFTDRQNTPSKQWKITDEDWRNREKWDLYEDAINEMLQKTNTTYAPWVILESNDKKYARIKALKTVIKMIEDRIG